MEGGEALMLKGINYSNPLVITLTLSPAKQNFTWSITDINNDLITIDIVYDEPLLVSFSEKQSMIVEMVY